MVTIHNRTKKLLDTSGMQEGNSVYATTSPCLSTSTWLLWFCRHCRSICHWFIDLSWLVIYGKKPVELNCPHFCVCQCQPLCIKRLHICIVIYIYTIYIYMICILHIPKRYSTAQIIPFQFCQTGSLFLKKELTQSASMPESDGRQGWKGTITFDPQKRLIWESKTSKQYRVLMKGVRGWQYWSIYGNVAQQDFAVYKETAIVGTVCGLTALSSLKIVLWTFVCSFIAQALWAHAFDAFFHYLQSK